MYTKRSKKGYVLMLLKSNEMHVKKDKKPTIAKSNKYAHVWNHSFECGIIL